MTLKLLTKGLTESREQCPNCYTKIFIFKDKEGNIKKLNGAKYLIGAEHVRQTDEIICDNCDSRLKAE